MRRDGTNGSSVLDRIFSFSDFSFDYTSWLSLGRRRHRLCAAKSHGDAHPFLSGSPHRARFLRVFPCVYLHVCASLLHCLFYPVLFFTLAFFFTLACLIAACRALSSLFLHSYRATSTIRKSVLSGALLGLSLSRPRRYAVLLRCRSL